MIMFICSILGLIECGVVWMKSLVEMWREIGRREQTLSANYDFMKYWYSSVNCSPKKWVIIPRKINYCYIVCSQSQHEMSLNWHTTNKDNLRDENFSRFDRK